MSKFKLSSKYKPAGDQPQAIKKLVSGLQEGQEHQTLLGVTGSGKTFTMANVIEKVQRPTLIVAHNKTLAAQLASEFREYFPENAVEYFVSYYDYYQPEAYLPSTDTYIEKDSSINDEIDKLRHRATAAVMERKDVIVVSSVSCIYGLGSPESYKAFVMHLEEGQPATRAKIIDHLVTMHYSRSQVLERGKFLAQGDVIQIVPPGKEVIYRIELHSPVGSNGRSTLRGVRSIKVVDLLTKKHLESPKEIYIFPAKHFTVEDKLMKAALGGIAKELEGQLKKYQKQEKHLEADRLERRTRSDLEMLREIGYCTGIENYSRHLTGRKKGEPPYTLMDYFPDDFLLFVDESHVTVPQIGGMYAGDRARKENLVEHGFRLPSALDNRPLKFPEFEERVRQAIYVSATPAKYELEHSSQVVEQVIRPTGLIDPQIEVRPARDQVQDSMKEIRKVLKRKERVLVTTLTKKQAEDLSDYLKEEEMRVNYLHSGVDTLDRIRTLDSLRKGEIDVLVGVNLLREGLDLPEVSLVVILDADKEGFLRSETSLIQTMGRAARNILGQVILYADNVTGSMRRAIDETNRRRELQLAHNKRHKITPQSIQKAIKSIVDHESAAEPLEEFVALENLEDIPQAIKQKEKEMKELAKNLEFERAALLRDEVRELKRIAGLKY